MAGASRQLSKALALMTRTDTSLGEEYNYGYIILPRYPLLEPNDYFNRDAEKAARFEQHANQGDLYAIERLYRVYDDTKLESYSSVTQYNASITLRSKQFHDEPGKPLYAQLQGKCAVEYTSPDYLASGRRQAIWQPLSPVDLALNSYHYADGRIGGWFPPKSLSMGGGFNGSSEVAERLASPKCTNELKCLSSAADSGNAMAAFMLQTLFRKTKLYYAWNSIGETSNPLFDIKKSNYFEEVYKFLNGKNDAFYPQYVEARLKDPEGMYDVAVAILNNTHVRKLYNQHHGLAEKSIEGAIDILKNAVNLGNANAAWQLARVYHEEYIADDKAQNLPTIFYWYSKAAELGHKEAAHHIAYFKAKFPGIEKQAEALALDLSNPTPAYLARRPDALGETVIPTADITLINTPGNTKQSSERAIQALDVELAGFDQVIASLAAKIDLLVSNAQGALERRAAISGKEGAIYNRVQALHEMRAALGMDRVPSNQPSLGDNLQEVAAGAITFKTTGSPILLSKSTALTLIKLGGMLANNNQDQPHPFEDYLRMQGANVELIHEEVRAIDKAMVEAGKAIAGRQTQKDELGQRRLLSSFLKKVLLSQGLDNIHLLEPVVKKEGFNSVDEVVAAASHVPPLERALKNFVRGFADTKDIETIMAYANAHSIGGKEADSESEKKLARALTGFVEDVIKPDIDTYFSLASRVDVLKQEGFDFDKNPNAVLAASGHNNPAFVRGLLETEYKVVGSPEVAKMFDFYLHRHGKHVIYDPKEPERQSDKTIELIEDQDVRKYVDIVGQKSKSGNRDLPTMPNTFMRLCAEEYLTPYIARQSAPAKFKDRPEASLAYVVANDVTKDFIEKMCLSPLAKYRANLKDKSLVDNVITQTFFDFFGHMGNTHATIFADGFRDLGQKFGTEKYNTLRHQLAKDVTQGLLERYDMYADLLRRNLKKTLTSSQAKEAKQLLAQLDELEAQGVSLIKPEVIREHASRYLHHLQDEEVAFHNMSPAARGRRGQ